MIVICHVFQILHVRSVKERKTNTDDSFKVHEVQQYYFIQK